MKSKYWIGRIKVLDKGMEQMEVDLSPGRNVPIIPESGTHKSGHMENEQDNRENRQTESTTPANNPAQNILVHSS